MPQMHLPFFPDGVEHITAELAFERKAGQITYFNGHMPVFIDKIENHVLRAWSEFNGFAS